MPDIRYVCLSDLHFGAENSILSRLVDGQLVVDTTQVSAALDALVAGMKALIDRNVDQSRRPTLILNGDVLELALASDNVALMVLEQFLDRVFPAEGDPLFEPTVYFQPGNHDHHLWETARERQYGNLLGRLGPDVPLPIPWHATSLFPVGEPPVQAEMLDQLAHRKPHRPQVNFRVSYPNMGLRSDDGRTVVVFHHGHFTEAIYHLMTTVKDLIFPGRVEPVELWDLEAENFAWIDFFWSTLGRSGDVGADVGLIYDLLQSGSAIDEAARRLAAGIAQRLPTAGVAGKFRWALRPLLTKGVRAVAAHMAASERRTPTAALSDASEAGLRHYLGGPLVRQLQSESANHGGELPAQVKFVFGHTHKPFVGVRDVPGLAQPVRIFNSGGWVVDTLAVEPLFGANMILIDEHLEVACVRLYNQAVNPHDYRVRLDEGLPAEQGPFYRRLEGLLPMDAEVWDTLSAAAAALVAERRVALQQIIDNAGVSRPTRMLPTPSPPARTDS